VHQHNATVLAAILNVPGRIAALTALGFVAIACGTPDPPEVRPTTPDRTSISEIVAPDDETPRAVIGVDGFFPGLDRVLQEIDWPLLVPSGNYQLDAGRSRYEDMGGRSRVTLTFTGPDGESLVLLQESRAPGAFSNQADGWKRRRIGDHLVYLRVAEEPAAFFVSPATPPGAESVEITVIANGQTEEVLVTFIETLAIVRE